MNFNDNFQYHHHLQNQRPHSHHSHLTNHLNLLLHQLSLPTSTSSTLVSSSPSSSSSSSSSSLLPPPPPLPPPTQALPLLPNYYHQLFHQQQQSSITSLASASISQYASQQYQQFTIQNCKLPSSLSSSSTSTSTTTSTTNTTSSKSNNNKSNSNFSSTTSSSRSRSSSAEISSTSSTASGTTSSTCSSSSRRNSTHTDEHLVSTTTTKSHRNNNKMIMNGNSRRHTVSSSTTNTSAGPYGPYGSSPYPSPAISSSVTVPSILLGTLIGPKPAMANNGSSMASVVAPSIPPPIIVHQPHQNETHDSLAASMPLLSSYLRGEPVRFGRVPKREKAKILAAMQKVNAHSLDKALSVLLEDEHSISAAISKAHEETCDYTREKVAPLLEAARSRPIYAQCPPQMACPLNPMPQLGPDGCSPNGANRILEDFSERFSPAIRGVVEFAKRIPGFGMLSQEDQVTLLKAGVFEVLLVRLACMFDSGNASMVCLNGLVLRRDALHSASNARFLLDSMFDFAERLNQLRLSDQVIGLFCAVVVIAPDRPGIRNLDLVQKINKKLEEVLQKAIAGNHPENSCARNDQLFQELKKKIPDLRTLNTLHSEKLLGKSFGALDTQSASATTTNGPHSTTVGSGSATTTASSSTVAAAATCPGRMEAPGAHHQQQQQQQPDSQSDNTSPERWSSSSTHSSSSTIMGHFSPTSTDDGHRSVSPPSSCSITTTTMGGRNPHHHLLSGSNHHLHPDSLSHHWNHNQQQQQQLHLDSSPVMMVKEEYGASPRSLSSTSSSSGVSSLDDSSSLLSRKGSISMPSAPPKLAYINSYVRGLSSTLSPDQTQNHHQQSQSCPMTNNHHIHNQSQSSPSQQQQQPQHNSTSSSSASVKLSRVDSPTDSGIESGKEHGSSSTPTTSVCSSPRSAIGGDDSQNGSNGKLKDHSDSEMSPEQHSMKLESIDDMPVLKRALQAPPLVNTNKLMDEAYRHHKKFRAARRTDSEPHSPSTTTGVGRSGPSESSSPSPSVTPAASTTTTTCGSILSASLQLPSGPSTCSSTSASTSLSSSVSQLATSHSTLLRTLEQPSRYLNEQQLKRTDLIHNIIMNTEAAAAAAAISASSSSSTASAITSWKDSSINRQSSPAVPVPATESLLFANSSATSQPQSSPQPPPPKHHDSPITTTLYQTPSGGYYHIPVVAPSANGPAPGSGCPFSNGNGGSPLVNTTPAAHQYHPGTHSAHLSQSLYASTSPVPAYHLHHHLESNSAPPPPTPSTLLVIGSPLHPQQQLLPQHSPLHHHQPQQQHQQQQQQPQYSHLQRCLTGSITPQTNQTIMQHHHHHQTAALSGLALEQDDQQPLNLSIKSSPSSPVSNNNSSATSTIKMELD